MAAAAALARMELKPKAKLPSSQEAIKNQGRSSPVDAGSCCCAGVGMGQPGWLGRLQLQAEPGEGGPRSVTARVRLSRTLWGSAGFCDRLSVIEMGVWGGVTLTHGLSGWGWSTWVGVCLPRAALRGPEPSEIRRCNLGSSLVVRKELMAEAAASEKGLSAEEGVGERLFPDRQPSVLPRPWPARTCQGI